MTASEMKTGLIDYINKNIVPKEVFKVQREKLIKKGVCTLDRELRLLK